MLGGISPEKKTKLLELQKNGIGERRGEGFGRIVFGWQSECKSKDTYTLRKANKKKPEKPSGEIPEQTRDIVQTIVKDFISKKVELSALREVKAFVHVNKENLGLPSKSLIGRLEAMVKILDKDKFREVLEKDLRKTARDRLEGCKDTKGGQTLFEYLKNHSKKITVEEIFKEQDMSEVKKLCEEKEINFKPEGDKDLENTLYHNYFQSFFSEMRRILKGG